MNYKLVIQSYIDVYTNSDNSTEIESFAFQYRDLTKLADLDTVPVPECIMEEIFAELERAFISKGPIGSPEKLWMKQKVQYYVMLVVDNDEFKDFRRERASLGRCLRICQSL